jgi:hypothetical protein
LEVTLTAPGSLAPIRSQSGAGGALVLMPKRERLSQVIVETDGRVFEDEEYADRRTIPCLGLLRWAVFAAIRVFVLHAWFPLLGQKQHPAPARARIPRPSRRRGRVCERLVAPDG